MEAEFTYAHESVWRPQMRLLRAIKALSFTLDTPGPMDGFSWLVCPIQPQSTWAIPAPPHLIDIAGKAPSVLKHGF